MQSRLRGGLILCACAVCAVVSSALTLLVSTRDGVGPAPAPPSVDPSPDAEALVESVPTEPGPTRVLAAFAGDEPQEASSSPLKRLDPAGVSGATRLEFLRTSHDMVVKTRSTGSGRVQARWEFALAQRCVAAILHEQGRAQFPDARDRARGGFRLDSSSDHAIAMDGALYRFQRGEFPAFDSAFDRDRRYSEDAWAPADEAHRSELEPELELLFSQAMACF